MRLRTKFVWYVNNFALDRRLGQIENTSRESVEAPQHFHLAFLEQRGARTALIAVGSFDESRKPIQSGICLTDRQDKSPSALQSSI